mmetsp:Transcript_23649/g.35005  ORF Transcript_23649/g.35005 Transcript_23649/m.35005 type:complete len:125 (+) Transcript_23649:1246-1620(+)
MGPNFEPRDKKHHEPMFEFASCRSTQNPIQIQIEPKSNLLDQTTMVGGLVVADGCLDSDTTKERHHASRWYTRRSSCLIKRLHFDLETISTHLYWQDMESIEYTSNIDHRKSIHHLPVFERDSF